MQNSLDNNHILTCGNLYSHLMKIRQYLMRGL